MQTENELQRLKEDKLQALNQANRDAGEAARHAARGTQSEVDEEVRQVRKMSDKMARQDRSYEDLSDKLQRRVQDAADDVENYSEELTRNTEERLDAHFSRAQKHVLKLTDLHLSTVQKVEAKFNKEVEDAETAAEYHDCGSSGTEKCKSSGSSTFSSRSVTHAMSNVAALALLAFACSMFFVMRRRRVVELPLYTLG